MRNSYSRDFCQLAIENIYAVILIYVQLELVTRYLSVENRTHAVVWCTVGLSTERIK